MDTLVHGTADAVPPVLPVAPARGRLARLRSLAEGVLFWGILAFGVLFPFLAAAYAFLST